MLTIELEYAKEALLELLEKAASGENIVITKNSVPFVKLTTAQEKRHPRRPGSVRGQIIIAEDFDAPLDDFKEYM
jgi:prevent-host-death family protein